MGMVVVVVVVVMADVCGYHLRPISMDTALELFGCSVIASVVHNVTSL